MKTIIFQLLSCLYLYDSGMLGSVCIRKQRLYTVFRRLAVIHHAAGIPSSGACGNKPCRRYTAFWRRREVCAKSVYRLLASKGLIAPVYTSIHRNILNYDFAYRTFARFPVDMMLAQFFFHLSSDRFVMLAANSSWSRVSGINSILLAVSTSPNSTKQ